MTIGIFLFLSAVMILGAFVIGFICGDVRRTKLMMQDRWLAEEYADEELARILSFYEKFWKRHSSKVSNDLTAFIFEIDDCAHRPNRTDLQ